MESKGPRFFVAQWLKWWFPVLKVHSRYGILAHCSRISHDVWDPLSKYGSLIMKRGSQKKGHFIASIYFIPEQKYLQAKHSNHVLIRNLRIATQMAFWPSQKTFRSTSRLRISPPVVKPILRFFRPDLATFQEFHTITSARDDLGWSTWDGHLRKKNTWFESCNFFEDPKSPRKKAGEKYLSVKTLPPLQQQKEWVYRKFPDKTKHVMILVTQSWWPNMKWRDLSQLLAEWLQQNHWYKSYAPCRTSRRNIDILPEGN